MTDKERFTRVLSTLTRNDIMGLCQVSTQLPPATVYAVACVESSGKGFFDGHPKLLFEDHVFYRELKDAGYNADAIAKDHPDFCIPKYQPNRARNARVEWQQYITAVDICEKCAIRASSWGMFQIMGFNFKQCGVKSEEEFVHLMTISEKEQLRLFLAFVKSNPKMEQALAQLKWADFARLYNGPAYAANKYDTKLEMYYAKGVELFQ